MNSILLQKELDKFKQKWCNRWMAAWKIQRRWRKYFSLPVIAKEKKDYISQVRTNYCHQLELLFYAINEWEMKGLEHVQIPICLFEIDKMRELILAISAHMETTFEIIRGDYSIYREKFINHYVATHRLTHIGCFRHIGASGPHTPKIVFISRPFSQRRRISNEQRLIEFLRPRIPNMEVYTFDDKSSAIDQAKLFSQCNMIIGLHGAGLANLLWMVGGHCGDGHIYEITPKGHYYHDYQAKAHFRGFTHRYIEIEKYERSEECLVYPRDSILHMSQDEMEKMAELMEIDGKAQKAPQIRKKLAKINFTKEIDQDEMEKMLNVSFKEL